MTRTVAEPFGDRVDAKISSQTGPLLQRPCQLARAVSRSTRALTDGDVLGRALERRRVLRLSLVRVVAAAKSRGQRRSAARDGMNALACTKHDEGVVAVLAAALLRLLAAGRRRRRRVGVAARRTAYSRLARRLAAAGAADEI